MKLFQDLLDIRDSLTEDKPFCYIYLLHNDSYNSDSNDLDKCILMSAPNIPFEGKFPYLLIKHNDNHKVLSNGLDYLLESESLDKGSTLNKLFSQLEQEEIDVIKMIENRNNIIESICRIGGKGPFKTKNSTIMIIEKNGKKFIRKIDKSAREIGVGNINPTQ